MAEYVVRLKVEAEEIAGRGWVLHAPEVRATASGPTYEEAEANLRDLIETYPEALNASLTNALGEGISNGLSHDRLGCAPSPWPAYTRTRATVNNARWPPLRAGLGRRSGERLARAARRESLLTGARVAGGGRVISRFG